MNREHPTGTERKSLNYECGWKGGDRGGLAEREKERKNHGESKKLLTGIGLLMEGPIAILAVASWITDQRAFKSASSTSQVAVGPRGKGFSPPATDPSLPADSLLA